MITEYLRVIAVSIDYKTNAIKIFVSCVWLWLQNKAQDVANRFYSELINYSNLINKI